MGTWISATRRAALLAALAAAVLLTTTPPAAEAMPLGGDRHPSAALMRLGTPDRRAVPVLMYHVIQRPYADSPYPALYVPRAEFAAQMSWLDLHGYEAVTRQRVYDAWHGRAVLPSRPVVVTFDDGYRSHYTNALPILRSHGWSGVLNLDLSNLAPWWGIHPSMVERLVAAGWEIDAHSLTHPDLTSLAGPSLRHEVRGSRDQIRRRFGVAANFFCYPAGRYDSEVVEAVSAAGFLGATTTEHGLAGRQEPFTLDRVRIDGGNGASGLAAKLAALA